MEKEDWSVIDEAPGNAWNPLRLFCQKEECRVYIKGTYSNYTGSFYAETGEHADLRDQVWYCDLHDAEH